MKKDDFLVVLTGAGISAESGVPTFRSNGGLWRQHRFEELATPEAFAADSDLVWDFYRWRQEGVRNAQPNRAHEILAEMEAELGERMLLVTQNVDDLHERGGSRKLLHMHGEIMKARCLHCGMVHGDYDYNRSIEGCPDCGSSVRPHIVWFGEMPFHMEEIQTALMRASQFIAIGTSGAVYPAAQFVSMAKSGGARTRLINLEAADNFGAFDGILEGKATEVLETLWLEGKIF
ncbi:MAG: NAD-dependent deacylase [Magnetococcales bacterium]|nr:NAD-dependent deacylase [Magnetococcales bacterium]